MISRKPWQDLLAAIALLSLWCGLIYWHLNSGQAQADTPKPPAPRPPACQLGIAAHYESFHSGRIRWRYPVLICRGPQGEPIIAEGMGR